MENVGADRRLLDGAGRKSPAAGFMSCGSKRLMTLSARICDALQAAFDGWHPDSSPSPSGVPRSPLKITLPRIRRLTSTVAVPDGPGMVNCCGLTIPAGL